MNSSSCSTHAPLISFVVMCYNTEAFVAECIESIRNLRGDYDWEIVAIDDCSKDGTVSVLESIRDPRLRILKNEVNRGPQEAATRALLATRGQFVTRMDSDDRYRPEFLDSTIPALQNNPRVGLVYGEAEMIDPQGKPCGMACTPRSGRGDWSGNELVDLLRNNFICNPTIIGRRECFADSLPVPGHIVLCDWYFNVNTARKWDFYFVDQVLADYRIHPGNFHNRLIADGSQEKTIFWVLDRVFASTEESPAIEAAKRERRGELYGSNYWMMAGKYFGHGMYADACRCYKNAVRNDRVYLLRSELYKRLLGLLMGQRGYEKSKAMMKQLLGRNTGAAEVRS